MNSGVQLWRDLSDENGLSSIQELHSLSLRHNCAKLVLFSRISFLRSLSAVDLEGDVGDSQRSFFNHGLASIDFSHHHLRDECVSKKVEGCILIVWILKTNLLIRTI